MTGVAAESISFKPGELSTSVKGRLVADQTKQYTFRGEAGQLFELATNSDRGQWLLVRVWDEQNRDILNNFESGELHLTAELPRDGNYTIYLALRRPEVQREGRLDYLMTLTLHPLPEMLVIEGEGDYFVSDGAGTRQVQSVSVGLGQAGDARVRVNLAGDSFTIRGRWEIPSDVDEVAALELTEAFGQKVRGQAMIVFSDDIDDQGRPLQIVLRFDALEAGTHHSLFFKSR